MRGSKADASKEKPFTTKSQRAQSSFTFLIHPKKMTPSPPPARGRGRHTSEQKNFVYLLRALRAFVVKPFKTIHQSQDPGLRRDDGVKENREDIRSHNP